MHSRQGDRLVPALLACHFSGRLGKGEASSMSCNTDQSHWAGENETSNGTKSSLWIEIALERLRKTLTDQTGKSPFHTEGKGVPL